MSAILEAKHLIPLPEYFFCRFQYDLVPVFVIFLILWKNFLKVWIKLKLPVFVLF